MSVNLEVYNRCRICRCFLDDEDLFCANCGTENPHADVQATLPHYEVEHHSFDCDGCGASMSYDASAQALRCPFCGSTAMTQANQARRTLHCDWIVPLSVDHQQAEALLRNWLGQGFWRPADAARAATIGEIAAVYVPFWVFEADADTMWTADSSPPPPGYRGDWCPVSGNNHSHHRDILVDGSSVLGWKEVSPILPFHLERAVRNDQVHLSNAIVETLKVPRKSARPIARAAIEEQERQICSTYVPGRARRIKVNVRIHGLMGRPMLLPVWVMAYRYRHEVHRVLINGQTGKIAGSAPFSIGRLLIPLMIVGGLILFLLLMALLMAGLAR